MGSGERLGAPVDSGAAHYSLQTPEVAAHTGDAFRGRDRDVADLIAGILLSAIGGKAGKDWGRVGQTALAIMALEVYFRAGGE